MYIHKKIVFGWDEEKNAVDQRKHGISFARAEDFAWHDAVMVDRTREQDGETRFAAIGFIDKRLHTVIFTKRDVYTRIISLRRANKSQERLYEKTVEQAGG